MIEHGPIGSIVIPAWNEANVIGRTLSALLAGIDSAFVEVIVACNGCDDDTAGIAAAAAADSDARVTVLDLPAIGKAGAIRAAESTTDVLPRLYLDADVTLPGQSAMAVLAALDDGAVSARPPLRYNLDGASWPVRRYYRQRSRLPGPARDLCGAGVYGLSATARARFGEFPLVIGDDLFAARIVEPHEVAIVSCAPAVVAAPRKVGSLLGTVARARSGNRELLRLFPELARSTTRSTTADLIRSVRRPSHLVDALVYATITGSARLKSMSGGASWARDDTTRASRP